MHVASKRPRDARGDSGDEDFASHAMIAHHAPADECLDIPQSGTTSSDYDVNGAKDYMIPDNTSGTLSDENICYGALCDAKAQVSSEAKLNIRALPWTLFYTFKIILRGEIYWLAELDDISTDGFAVVDLNTMAYLQSLRQFPQLSFTAIVSSSVLSSLSRMSARQKLVLDMTVNIIGPPELADEVGEAVAKASGYLQHPVFLDPGTPYVNPHYFYSKDEDLDLRHFIGQQQETLGITHIVEGIEDALASLDAAFTPQGSRMDEEAPTLIQQHLKSTTLKSHQIVGLEYIRNREDPDLCHPRNSDLLCLISPRYLSNPRILQCGGIIADVMGLGKTLTMLSAIVCSKQETTPVESLDGMKCESLRLTKATLVVLPSTQVLDVWKAEIERRFLAGALDVYDFHGRSRASTRDALLRHDIVLTTYHTLAADWKGRRILQDIGWLRVVLDEAHWIRNQSTQFFKAAAGLQTNRRWCLTGTPIQNSLEDLRSLLKFLHFDPFSEAKFFDEHIVAPLRSQADDSFRNLKALLRTFCLRRGTDYLQLPPWRTDPVSVALSSEETQAYQLILDNCVAEFDRITSGKSDSKKKYSVLFTTIMKLRRLCNHGTIALPADACRSLTPSGKRRKLKKAPSTGIEDSFCEFCSSVEEDASASLTGLDTCPECYRCLVESTNLSSGSSSRALRATNSPSDTSMSPSPSVNTPLSPLSPSGLHSGHSSKLLAVADNICMSLLDTDSKSIVFTSWQSTLDILANMLQTRGVQSLQIDGRVPFKERTVLLSKFRDDPAMRVLLMSINTGGVGLTLTNADRVHIVEPQWNPSAEEQAIGRALRMGQTRPVTIFKYVTEKTLEKNIVDLQQKKSRLARFSLDPTADDKAVGNLDDLKFVLDPTMC